jgi:uncharacterized protein (TIGR02677 family)
LADGTIENAGFERFGRGFVADWTVDSEGEATGAGAARPDLGPSREPRLTLFAYTVADLAPLYRGIAALFLETKARYRIQLRPLEVAAELRSAGYDAALLETTVDRALDQLVDWGNLRRSHDTGRVATLEDFRRRHFVYQLTPAGETAERAVGDVVAALERSGSLQRVMLGSILRNLHELLHELSAAAPQAERLYESLFNLTEQFRALTENASTFLARLHEAIDQGEVHDQAFLLYKQAVLGYLEDFLGELATLAPQIAAAIRAIEGAGVERLVVLAGRADSAPTPLGIADPTTELRQKWRGIAAWFLGDRREAATVELLRAAARGAINRILLVLERLHEKRFRRFSRTTELLRLAAAFDGLASESSGAERSHRLFQAVFGLFGARHLGGRHEDPDRIRQGASWWEAPPVPITPALRETGRVTATGRPGQIADHSAVKRYLAERHRRERDARSQALARFAGRGPQALGELPPLSPDEFQLLLTFLDRLLASPVRRLGRREVSSRDGRLRLVLDEPESGRLTRVQCPAGRLTLPAYVLTVEDRMAPAVHYEATA